MPTSRPPQRSLARRVCLVALLALVLGACSPPGQGRVIRDIAIDADGELHEINSGLDGYAESTDEAAGEQLTEVGQATEACLESGTCVRIADGSRIEESTDRWDTFDVVWEIEPDASWWGHEYDDGWYEPVIGLFDIVVLPDQTVAVASGQLPVIERSADGEWTPTVADLRTLPNPIVLIPALAGFLLITTLAAGAHHGARLARSATTLALPGFVILAAVTLHPIAKSTGFLILVALSVLVITPLLPIIAGLAVEALKRANLHPGLLQRQLLLIGLNVGTATAISLGAYLLWSNDRLSWLTANAIWVLSLLSAMAIPHLFAKRLVVEPPPRIPEIDHPTSLTKTILSGYFLGITVTVLAIGVTLVLESVIVVSFPIGLILWVGGGGWFLSKYAARIPYETVYDRTSAAPVP